MYSPPTPSLLRKEGAYYPIQGIMPNDIALGEGQEGGHYLDGRGLTRIFKR